MGLTRTADCSYVVSSHSQVPAHENFKISRAYRVNGAPDGVSGGDSGSRQPAGSGSCNKRHSGSKLVACIECHLVHRNSRVGSCR